MTFASTPLQIADADISPGGQRALLVGGVCLLLCREVSGRLHAVTNLCPHALLPLTDGMLQGQSLTCPKHGARFDLVTGQPLNGITRTALKVHRVEVRQGVLEVCLNRS